MALVRGGEFLPLYGAVKNEMVQVKDFYMDAKPVTHADFLEFVQKNPQWKKSMVKKIFADERYLTAWDGDQQVPSELHNSPVNNISWFAAKAYCECQGKRLPTVDEWEYAAMADEKIKDARKDSLYNVKIIRTYEKPKTHLLKVGQGEKNYWGIFDLHGLVWEWTQDFNSVIIAGESRNNGNGEKGLFCASGAVGANDLMNYAAFMRYAIRASLKANHTVTTKGFRCVKDANSNYLVQK
ncbi:formylglycine-generating enzyme family protein [Litoribacter ruber]|nr:formylglycine-generating enzyme family protein [Litoribacter ruber]